MTIDEAELQLLDVRTNAPLLSTKNFGIEQFARGRIYVEMRGFYYEDDKFDNINDYVTRNMEKALITLRKIDSNIARFNLIDRFKTVAMI